jgi:hypothetical protein
MLMLSKCARPSLREGLGGSDKVGYPKSEENKGTIVRQRVVAQPMYGKAPMVVPTCLSGFG